MIIKEKSLKHKNIISLKLVKFLFLKNSYSKYQFVFDSIVQHINIISTIIKKT